MTFDLSHLYKTETVDVKLPDGKTLFQVVVREITHGEKTQAQTAILSEVEMPTEGSKKSRQREMKRQWKEVDKGGAAAKSALKEEISAIVSWTLTDAKGNPIPVCIEVWRELPASLCEQIVEAIERLSPELDDDFQGELGSAS
jgi:hypothetical protein